MVDGVNGMGVRKRSPTKPTATLATVVVGVILLVSTVLTPAAVVAGRTTATERAVATRFNDLAITRDGGRS